jgi:predicted component of type VI protein secretion system
MTKYRFFRSEGGTITVRAERVLGKQLVASITQVIGPDEDVSTAMKELHKKVQAMGFSGSKVGSRASERRIGT